MFLDIIHYLVAQVELKTPLVTVKLRLLPPRRLQIQTLWVPLLVQGQLNPPRLPRRAPGPMDSDLLAAPLLVVILLCLNRRTHHGNTRGLPSPLPMALSLLKPGSTTAGSSPWQWTPKMIARISKHSTRTKSLPQLR
jgi:hypothetical protein